MKSDCERILDMLADGEWHTGRSLRNRDYQAGGPGFALHSRAADLRKKGYEIECRHADGRDWEYRLLVHQTTLFQTVAA